MLMSQRSSSRTVRSVREQWRAIPGYEGRYEVSDRGRVRSLVRGKAKIMVAPIDRYGYARLSLRISGGRRNWRVHQLVALAFIGPCPPGLDVLHGDGVKTNCIPSNLRYGTQSENTIDMTIHGSHNMRRKTHCDNGHEFTDENTSMAAGRNGSKARRCKSCDVIRTRNYRAQRRDSSRIRQAVDG